MLLPCYQLAASLSGTIDRLNSDELCFHDEHFQNVTRRKNCHHQTHEYHNHTDCARMGQVPGTQTILADNYVYGVSTHISTAAQVSAPHTMYTFNVHNSPELALSLMYMNP